MAAAETLLLLVSMHRIVRHLRRSRTTTVMHPTQFLALMLIADEQPIRIGEIATRVPCSQPTATTTVAALEEAGLVRREPDPVDGRATAVVLTEAGAATVQASGQQAADELSHLLNRLDDTDRALVLKAGQALSRITKDL
ncbi:MarR family winged helix-turn-helix transcriptional regulator [Kribbella pratensis]|jgi:DNA-binding MarR family transcriptional regulator|uniref:DNA-binding MarR family transcriptional regulator n=1 Tax=Kribbella pratensis TaxID=2512112 RepID=A0A4V3GG58_9ACTN|nr:MarR family transcriptional regulator [Kribbella pratensis]TDW70857.1 DNA-binding MarR family transcriptional regulator [Kribbella pratensis]